MTTVLEHAAVESPSYRSAFHGVRLSFPLQSRNSGNRRDEDADVLPGEGNTEPFRLARGRAERAQAPGDVNDLPKLKCRTSVAGHGADLGSHSASRMHSQDVVTPVSTTTCSLAGFGSPLELRPSVFGSPIQVRTQPKILCSGPMELFWPLLLS
jgi:hypothetical protein